jgi:hypothetical protein
LKYSLTLCKFYNTTIWRRPWTANDWRIDAAIDSGMLRAAAPIPVKKYLREPWWKIGDQG